MFSANRFYFHDSVMDLEQSLRRILLIDDSPDDRLLTIRELNREFPQVQIEEILNFDQLVQAIEINHFDLAITDYDLQWTTGLDVLRLIKTGTPERPVVMFTNSGTQEVAVEAMKTGLDDYVVKSPKHFVRLTQAISSVWAKTQTQQKAKQLQLQLQFLLNQLEVGVFRATLEGQLIEVSDGFLKLLGLNSLEDAQLFFESQPAFSQIDRSDSQWEREMRLTCPDRRTIWIQISETIIEQSGKVLLDGLIRDITEKKQTAAALQELNQTLENRVTERTARLELLNRELESFAFSVSHDLRSPIRQIDGFINLLRQHLESSCDRDLDETAQHYLNRLAELTDRSGNMIDDLLQFSRTGRAEMHYTSVNMERLVQEIRVQLEPQLLYQTAHWQVEPLPRVFGDRNLLRQVWQNLLENAVKYSSQREQSEIAIGSFTNELETVFFVRDNGIGFETQSAQQLFGIFQRLYNASDFDGTGIGLANVQRIVYRHGGRVWAEGIPDQGATFYFSIPLSESDDNQS